MTAHVPHLGFHPVIDMMLLWKRLDMAEQAIRDGLMTVEIAAQHYDVAALSLQQRLDNDRLPQEPF